MSITNYYKFYSTQHLFKGKSCGKSWSFTRVPMYEFVGVPTEEVSFHGQWDRVVSLYAQWDRGVSFHVQWDSG